jgi:hypothetical protein
LILVPASSSWSRCSSTSEISRASKISLSGFLDAGRPCVHICLCFMSIFFLSW